MSGETNREVSVTFKSPRTLAAFSADRSRAMSGTIFFLVHVSIVAILLLCHVIVSSLSFVSVPGEGCASLL